MMKKLSVLALAICIQLSCSAQEFEKELRPFTAVIASPRIHVVLEKGSRENVRVVYQDVSKEKINVFVKGKTLHLFLDEARKLEPTTRGHKDYGSRYGIYEGVTVTAYITYTYLESLEIRGNQAMVCEGAIDTERFVLRAYGENNITFNSLKTDYFKASLFGENRLTIKDGKVVEQKYRLFGENKIRALDLKSAYTTTNIFGEAQLQINTTEEVIVNAFGEPVIHVDGGAYINKRLVFGEASISKR